MQNTASQLILYLFMSVRKDLFRGSVLQITPISIIEFATFRNPAILAPFT